ncbi:MAG: cellulase family glycosylhydrolase [Oscillospiraceae bacterium]|nr:cellulase family glycosylhydrolase [Oscillospiraceae bacterium]
MHRTGRITACVAAALALVLPMTGCTAQRATFEDRTGGSHTDSAGTQSEAPAPQQGTAAPEDAVPEETQAPTEPPTEYVSPRENVCSILGAQTDVDVVLHRDTDNTYKASLSELIEEGDIVHSFVFVFYAEDGVSNIGTYKGGCGISVTADCPAATDDGWYQSEDFTTQANGSYVEVRWDVPVDVQTCVDAGGQVLIGYWWGNTTGVRLKNVICTYARNRELPVDGTETVTVDRSVGYDDADNTLRVPLDLPEGATPQAVTYSIRADKGFGKFTGAFGIKTDDWYQTGTIAVPTSADSLDLVWIIPEEVKSRLADDPGIMLGYWWGEPAQVTLRQVSVRYSYGPEGPPAGTAVQEAQTEAPVQSTPDAASQPASGGKVTVRDGGDAQPAAVPDAGTVQEDTPQETPQQEGQPQEETPQQEQTPAQPQEVQPMTQMRSAAQIVSELHIGWNLGNTLDCYNVDWQADSETAWGNPKTTKAMIDSVKAQGFSAVRIPVTWGDHLSGGNTVDGAWMDRVQEVVDYAVSDGMYVILNMHHDDYTWLNPTYADETAVTEKYTAIWSQIAARFRDYDDHLLFEGLNEPRVIGSANEWTGGTPEERDVINHLLAAFVRTVRDSGGNNAGRALVVTTHAASITDAALDGLVLPDDGNLIVSIHNYAPWKFTAGDFPSESSFTDAGRAELDREFDTLRSKFLDRGIPVIIGEFGAENKNNAGDRTAYYSYYISAAAQRGIPCFIWDNGVASGEGSYGLLDRTSLSWKDGIAEAAVSAAP